MNYRALPSQVEHGRWRHHSYAAGGSVARVYVHMLTPEALRTVIGVSVTLYMEITLLAGKVFYRAFKALRHRNFRIL